MLQGEDQDLEEFDKEIELQKAKTAYLESVSVMKSELNMECFFSWKMIFQIKSKVMKSEGIVGIINEFKTCWISVIVQSLLSFDIIQERIEQFQLPERDD